MDRYDRIEGFDFSAGDGYWTRSAPVWERVRRRWDRALAEPGPVRVADSCRGEPAFAAFFSLAEEGVGADPSAASRTDAALDSLFRCVLPGTPAPARP